MRESRSIDAAFQDFHAANPEVYAELVRLARTAKATGMDKAGIKMLYEVTRWTFQIAKGAREYKLPNNFHSRYARLIMEREPDLAGFFNTHQLKAA